MLPQPNNCDDDQAVPYSRIRAEGSGVTVERLGQVICANAPSVSAGLRRLLEHERLYPDGVECCAIDELAARDELALMKAQDTEESEVEG